MRYNDLYKSNTGIERFDTNTIFNIIKILVLMLLYLILFADIKQ